MWPIDADEPIVHLCFHITSRFFLQPFLSVLLWNIINSILLLGILISKVSENISYQMKKFKKLKIIIFNIQPKRKLKGHFISFLTFILLFKFEFECSILKAKFLPQKLTHL